MRDFDFGRLEEGEGRGVWPVGMEEAGRTVKFMWRILGIGPDFVLLNNLFALRHLIRSESREEYQQRLIQVNFTSKIKSANIC